MQELAVKSAASLLQVILNFVANDGSRMFEPKSIIFTFLAAPARRNNWHPDARNRRFRLRRPRFGRRCTTLVRFSLELSRASQEHNLLIREACPQK